MKRSLPKEEDFVPARKKQPLSLEAKRLLIKEFDKGARIRDIVKKYKIPESTARTILKSRDRIFSFAKNDKNKTWLLTETESILKLWCSDQLRDNIEVTKESVCEQATELFESLKLRHSEYGDETFEATDSWYDDFKSRCDWDQAANELETTIATASETAIATPIASASATPIAIASATPIASASATPIAIASATANPNDPQTNIEKLRQAIEEGRYSPQTVFNVSETLLFWKKMPDKSHIARLEKSNPSTGFKESYDRITIMVGGNAAGDFKIKPLIIYRTENPKALHGKSKGGLPVFWESNPTACMTSFIFEDWFGTYFIPSVQRYCSSNSIPFKVMLIVTSTPAHLPSTLTDYDHRVKIFFTSPYKTNSMQPMYTELIPIFKAEYTRHLLVHLKLSLEQNGADRGSGQAVMRAWQEYNILNAIRIIADSWESISQDDWDRAWEKIFPSLSSNEADGCEGSTMVEHNRVSQIVEDIVKLAMDLGLNIFHGDIILLLESHSKKLRPKEVVKIRAQNLLEEQEISESISINVSNMTAEKLTEALDHIKTGLNILEDIDSNESRARSTKKEILKLILPYHETLNGKIIKTDNKDDDEEYNNITI